MVRVKTSISKSERQEQILTEVRLSSAVRIADLAAKFGISAETIRRDLDWLGEMGLLNRTYGGGTAPLTLEPDMRDRHRQRVEERWRIAVAAAALVETGEAIMIDAGSTTLHFAVALAGMDRKIVCVTNGISIADALSKGSNIKVILCPGELNAPQGGVVGPETLQFLRRLNANRAFIGASGLTADGPTEADSGIAWVKRAMIERASEVNLLIDCGKFGKAMLEVVCPLTAIDRIVTDAQPGAQLAKAIKRSGGNLLIA